DTSASRAGSSRMILKFLVGTPADAPGACALPTDARTTMTMKKHANSFIGGLLEQYRRAILSYAVYSPALPELKCSGYGLYADCQREIGYRGRSGRHAASVGASRCPESEGHQVRLRRRTLRSVH